jgi:hypothetical protein
MLPVQQLHRQTMQRRGHQQIQDRTGERVSEQLSPRKRRRDEVQAVQENQTSHRFRSERTATGKSDHKDLRLGRLHLQEQVLPEVGLRGAPGGVRLRGGRLQRQHRPLRFPSAVVRPTSCPPVRWLGVSFFFAHWS